MEYLMWRRVINIISRLIEIEDKKIQNSRSQHEIVKAGTRRNVLVEVAEIFVAESERERERFEEDFKTEILDAEENFKIN